MISLLYSYLCYAIAASDPIVCDMVVQGARGNRRQGCAGEDKVAQRLRHLNQLWRSSDGTDTARPCECEC